MVFPLLRVSELDGGLLGYLALVWVILLLPLDIVLLSTLSLRAEIVPHLLLAHLIAVLVTCGQIAIAVLMALCPCMVAMPWQWASVGGLDPIAVVAVA